ncbi:hypothetical protein Q5Y75_05595 [Ruegeria sp. 2205SS24-7]|uniref:hypothetical protein n=1 Tax=Ruegeria discodermiae TaxID=3064389 RepID=UPI00274145FB|nr:hypothetical protein [Ruegeria sp. 2205SS24-7]MDP5216684.1 hypothetical protein [Ruegeria sp. 2205SS24-7]
MPVIFPDVLVRQAILGVRAINSDAINLRARSSEIEFDNLRAYLDRMRKQYLDTVQPLLDAAQNSASAVNTTVAAHTIGAPADTHAALIQLRSDLEAFYSAYEVVFSKLTHVTFSLAEGHKTASIPLSELASLAAPLDGVIASSAFAAG